MKIKLCRRESKEAGYFAGLTITDGSEEMDKEQAWIIEESRQFVLIFNSMLN